ncbi:MAG: SDR family oxidoreductase [Pseudomonadota bacterium]|nr:SDR family oxidoreductase [Pseudomonadota bacterium]
MLSSDRPRNCLVTGANRGLGLEFVRQLLTRGDRVIATARHPGRANELNRLVGEHPGRLHVLPLDVAAPRSHAELARELPLLGDGVAGSIDLLINNAGVLHSGERFGSVSFDNLDDSLRTNASGPFLLTQTLADSLAKGATVANLSSRLGSIASTGGFGTPTYAISKAALNMATVLLAHALAERDITVIALHPGWVRTGMGGPSAEIEPADAVSLMLAVIGRVSHADSGSFLDRHGATVPW